MFGWVCYALNMHVVRRKHVNAYRVDSDCILCGFKMTRTDLGWLRRFR